jgi:predicted ester cyclase
MSAKENRAATERVFKKLAAGDMTAAQSVLTTHLKRGAESSAKEAKTVFPDIRIKLEDTVAEGDKVVARWTATGTHKGNGKHALFGAVKPTGKPFRTTGITILRFEGGHVVETWGVTDELGVARQLGVVGQRK